jgi:peroxiredoxin
MSPAMNASAGVPRVWIVLGLLLLLLVFLAATRLRSCSEKQGREALVGETAPSLNLTDLGGVPVRLEELRGSVVLLNFWATWCGPCKREIPDFIRFQETYAGGGLAIIGVALDKPAAVASFAERMNVNYRIAVGDDATAETFGGIHSIPTSFLIDRKGVIRAVEVGYRAPALWDKDIRALLDEAR